MVPIVLIVDDDPDFLRLTEKELEEYAETLSVETAESGKVAFDKLKSENVAVVVTDLRMPGVDGFELLSHTLKKYPDIPVIAMTGHDRPKTRDVVVKSGAADYIVKPFETAELVDRINKLIHKRSEGGSLNNVSLETFLQLVEMEQQTCTLRVTQKSGKQAGVLFFRDGDLMDARTGENTGETAAYKILSWSGVSLSIENACGIETKQINGGLQAILLEAMRSKDEQLEVEDEQKKKENQNVSRDSLLLDDPVSGGDEDNDEGPSDKKKPEKSSSKSKAAKLTPPPELTLVEVVYNKLEEELGTKGGIRDVYSVTSGIHVEQVDQATRLGEIFAAGALNMIYMNKSKNGQFLLIPGDETIVAVLEPSASRDRIIGALL